MALQLIEEIEDKKLCIGEVASDFTKEEAWLERLIKEHPVLSSLPSWIQEGLKCEVGEWNHLPCNKRMRKRMKRDGYLLHLFAGPDQGFTLHRAWHQVGGESWQLLEVDVERGEEHNLLKSKLYGGLMRTALEGKIRAIIGGPNCRTRSVLRHIPVEGHPEAPRPVRQWGGGEFGKKDLTDQEREQVRGDDLLMWRMLFLQMVSTYAARARGATKDPLFSLEQPASPKRYKPEVVSFWDTKEWHKLKKEFGWFEETFEQGSLGRKSPKPTTFGGSLKLTVEEYKTGDRRHPERVKNSRELSRWPPALMRMLATELMKQVYKIDPKIKQLSWQEHIACGHIPYRRDCRVCQETNQQCAPHRKTRHVIGGVLSVDTAGPLIGAYDQGGGMARYFLVGALTWRVPKGLEKLKQPAQEPLEGDEPKIEDKEDAEEEALEDGIFGDLPPMGADHNQAPGGELAAELGLGGGDPVRLAAPPRSDDVAELGLGGGDPVRLAAPLPDEAAAELGLGGGDPVRLVAPSEEKGPEDLEEKTEVRVFRLALPMITKTAREVSATAMEFVLRLRADGFHIGRIHCDRGHEFEGAFKRWARSRGIYVTKTAGDDPQGNGRAEVAVKAIKSQIRRTLRQAGLDSAHWPWALRYVDELNRCVRKGIQPNWPPFYQEVRVKKRTWRRGAFEPVVERVHYLCPSTEDHGHWVQKPGEPPRVTKFIMEKTTEPVEEGAWIALEGRIVDPWSTRRRLRGKTAVRRVHPTLDQEGEDSETEKKKEEVKQIYAVIEEEMRGIVDEDPEVASGIIHAVARLRKIATVMEESEEVLQTKIISPKEVSRKWGEWLESVDSEVQSLTKDKQALKELTAEEHEELKQQAEREGRRVEYIPSKLVHVVKAGEKGGKKKTRWVVCGNFEEKKEGEENYSGGADATAFRILIWCCGKFQWRAQIIDVRTAFLNADLELTEEENLLLIRPPHIMIEKGYLAPNTVYLPVKAIYGFRRSPRLWGRHRDHRMHQFVIKAEKEGKHIEVQLFQMGSEPNLWKVVQVMGEEEDELASLSNGRILGLVMTYVDDVFIAAEGDLVEAITAKFQETWTTSSPEEVSEKSTRFLGMEVEKIWSEEKERSEWFVTQSGYIKDLLERYDQGKEEKEKRVRKIPISRDLAIMEEDSQPPDLKRVRQCQREVGELLWLVTRTRPDLMYTISRMGAHVTKSTVKVLEAAEQTRDYLRGTWDQGLKFEEGKEKEVVIQVWSDASFAPEGEESHGCFTVMVNDSALLWRSGRQASITLSTAEAELNELIEAMNAGESVATILYELFDDVKKIGWSDSQSALSILSSEGGSWRTRHLRMRASYARQAVLSGDWAVGHVPGEELNADMGTKALSSNRLDKLKGLLGMAQRPGESIEEKEKKKEVGEDQKEKASNAFKVSQAATAVKLITLAAMISVGKSEEDEDEEQGEKELKVMMVLFAITIVLLTLLGQIVWKVGVGKLRQVIKDQSEGADRSLPAQGDQTGVQQRAREAVRGTGGELGSSGSSEPLVRLPPSVRVEEENTTRRVEMGLDPGNPVRLPVPEGETSSSSGGPSPAAGSMEARIEEELIRIIQEEAEMWREIRQTPLPPVIIEEVEENDAEGLRFNVLRTTYGVVYHSDRSCRHLQGPRVGQPRLFKWCQVCRRVALQTRGRPPPGTSLYLSVTGNAAHSDERCPWIREGNLTPFCQTCREREG